METLLSLLHIENIALIDQADLSFGPGFNVLTGETGAGKSIIIDAIGAVMGERTSRDLIRSGEKSALVTALFRDLPQLPWFEETGIAPDENGELLISRKIQGDGKNICRVGGVPCTVLQLKALGGQLIDIHGQHDGQQLLDETCHLGYLDSFGGLAQAVEGYRKDYEALSTLRRQLAALEMDEAEKARRIDSLQFQIAELERADLRAGEEEELAERKALLRSAVGLMGEAEAQLSRVSALSEELGELAGVLTELRCGVEDATERLRELRRGFDFSPQELAEVESRLDLLYRLKKKYGATTTEMLDYLERSREELERIQLADESIAKLEKKQAKLLEGVRDKAQALSEQRKVAAQALRERIQTELRQLDMPKVRFETDFAPKAGQLGLDETGMDEVRFLMSANVGEDLKPIAKVASGGELSRIMLALKNVLAENDSIMTLIFDEVDAGISGRAAGKVAEKMSALSAGSQVLCVTHLAQIAAMADAHFSVQKEERKGRTYTEVLVLDRDGRRQELARLTGGATVSAAILEGAEALLQEAEAYRAARG